MDISEGKLVDKHAINNLGSLNSYQLKEDRKEVLPFLMALGFLIKIIKSNPKEKTLLLSFAMYVHIISQIFKRIKMIPGVNDKVEGMPTWTEC